MVRVSDVLFSPLRASYSDWLIATGAHVAVSGALFAYKTLPSEAVAYFEIPLEQADVSEATRIFSISEASIGGVLFCLAILLYQLPHETDKAIKE